MVWVAAAATVAVTLSAGIWQLGRAEQKKSAESALLKQRELPAWTGADWPCRTVGAVGADTSSPASVGVPMPLPVQRPVVLRGHWLAGRTVFLDNRPMGVGTGFIVVTPLRLSPTTGGTCQNGIVLVQRGWVPRHAHDRLLLPSVDTPEVEVEVIGRVMSALSQVYQLGVETPPGQASAPLVRQNADTAFWSAWLGQAPLMGAVLQVRAAEPSDAAVLQRQWPEPGQGQDKHLAYAAQWFAMAGVVAGLTIWFQIIRPSRQRRSRDHVPS
jgi:surfeit locus 1 family protein